ncbi:MAG: hypothetical protein MUP52_01950 [Candidatus Aminicenantes bacterium]|jgi:hypothetical protein|nr:hypothetical protein [Candidatus Aminicenantes bacterium]
MKLREKLAIFVVAVLLTLVGFNLIAAPSVDILKIGKQAGYEIIANYLAKVETAAQRSLIKG